MNVTQKVKKILKKNDPQIVAEEIAKTYVEKKEGGEEHPIDNTVEKAMEKIKQSPEPEKVFAAMIEQKDIPDRVIEKTATKISRDSKIPDQIITLAVKKSEKKVPSNLINTIIEEGDIEVSERFKLIRNVDDKEILEQRIENELKILYKLCRDKRDIEITDRIQELQKIIGEKDVSIEMHKLIQQVVARKMAENYYSDFSKSTKIYTFSKAIPVRKMLEIDLPSKVQEEYKKIEDEEGVKEGRFDKHELKEQMIRELEKSIRIENEKHKDNGNIKLKSKEKELIEYTRNLSEKNRKETIETLLRILRNQETVETILMLEQLGLIEQFNNMPEERRKKTIKSIGDVLTKHKHKISKNPPKIKENQKIEIDVEEDR